MTRSPLVLVAAVVGLALAAGRPQAQQGPTPVFRTTTDAVTVNVSVRHGSDQVGGLTAKDFVLLDNNVPQRIDEVDPAVVPVDLTLLIDTSSDLARFADDSARQAARIAAGLRPIDRLRVWTIGT